MHANQAALLLGVSGLIEDDLGGRQVLEGGIIRLLSPAGDIKIPIKL